MKKQTFTWQRIGDELLKRGVPQGSAVTDLLKAAKNIEGKMPFHARGKVAFWLEAEHRPQPIGTVWTIHEPDESKAA